MKAEQIEKINEIEQLKSLYFVSLISAESLVSADACKEAINMAKETLGNLDEAKIPEKDKKQWEKFMKDAIEIATRDLNKLYKDEIN